MIYYIKRDCYNPFIHVQYSLFQSKQLPYEKRLRKEKRLRRERRDFQALLSSRTRRDSESGTSSSTATSSKETRENTSTVSATVTAAGKTKSLSLIETSYTDKTDTAKQKDTQEGKFEVGPKKNDVTKSSADSNVEKKTADAPIVDLKSLPLYNKTIGKDSIDTDSNDTNDKSQTSKASKNDSSGNISLCMICRHILQFRISKQV